MSSSTPIFISNLSEKRWIKHITQNYTNDLKNHPCVFQVPQTMKDTKPEAYAPQVVGLGPYHHFRPELQQMESKKRDAVREYINRNEFDDFIKLVNGMTADAIEKKQKGVEKKEMREGVTEYERELEKFEPTIRSSYDRYLDLDGETLSWIIVVDGIFLLHIVKNYLEKLEEEKKKDKNGDENKKKKDKNVDQKEEKKENIVELERLVPDILMLENQIPLELLIQIRYALKRSFNEATDIDLFDNFTRFCVEHSPLKLDENPESMPDAFEKHMLHYMYKLIVGNYDSDADAGAGAGADASASASSSSSAASSRASSQESLQELVQGEPENPDEKSLERCSPKDVFKQVADAAKQTASQVTDAFKTVAELASPHAKDFAIQVGDSVNSGYERVLSSGVEVPSNVELAARFLQQLRKNSNVYDQADHPLQKILVQEINVPTASQLHQIAKMNFKRTDGGIKNVRMDLDTNTLYLPVITLRANSEVVLRNLVAYEAASAKPGSTLELTEYLDLMCGIIDSEKDVKLLKEEKIIEGEDLGNDEIVSIFNGINKSTKKPAEKSKVQKIVDDVNDQFSNIGIVRAYTSLKKILGRLQDLIIKVFPLLVLILLTLQYICDVRGCSSHRLGNVAVSQDSSFGDGSSLSVDSDANYLMMPRKMLRYSS